jgi:hypothetical protein
MAVDEIANRGFCGAWSVFFQAAQHFLLNVG